MNVNAIIDGIAAAVDTIAPLRVFSFAADNVVAPAAIVDLPELVQFDDAMGRGADRLTIPVHVLIGRVVDRSARDAVSDYLAGSGAKSVKAAIESDPTLGGVAMTTRVVSAAVDIITVGGIDYVAATFTLDILA